MSSVRTDSASSKPRILLLHTGGTFGMSLDASSQALAPTILLGNTAEEVSATQIESLARHIPELNVLARIEARVLCNLDSSDMGPAQWETIARTIHEAWDTFDGVVVVHGTDTLAFTACALSFFLTGLTKTVVLTGSQRPLLALRTDARARVLASDGIPVPGLWAAGNAASPMTGAPMRRQG